MSLRESYANHILVLDKMSKFRHYADYKKYSNFLKKISLIDSIRNYEEFAECIREVAVDENLFIHIGYAPSSYFYGYYDAFVDYAGVRNKISNLPLFSHMEHGWADLGNYRSPFSLNSLSYCSMSYVRKKEIHQMDPWRIFVSTGPYIHYADKFLNDNVEKEIKNKNGKTLLVIPFHTCEGEYYGSGMESFLFEQVYSKYADKYDTILVCVYWHNVNDNVIKEYKKNGAKLVSAGFRGDIKFLSRLKSIISLADDVVLDEPGTILGFCYYMGKSTFIEEREDRFIDEGATWIVKKLREAFHSPNLIFTSEQLSEQKKLFDLGWGGEFIKSRKEARAILLSLNKILKMTKYNISADCVDRNTRKLLHILQESKTRESLFQYKVIRETLR